MFDFFIYFKLRNILINIKMNAEDLLDKIPLDIPQDVQHAAGQAAGTLQQHMQQQKHMQQQDSKRERQSAIVAGGGSRQYLGRDLQLSDIDGMKPQEVDKLYCRYEARLGASMTQTFGNSFIN